MDKSISEKRLDECEQVIEALDKDLKLERDQNKKILAMIKPAARIYIENFISGKYSATHGIVVDYYHKSTNSIKSVCVYNGIVRYKIVKETLSTIIIELEELIGKIYYKIDKESGNVMNVTDIIDPVLMREDKKIVGEK